MVDVQAWTRVTLVHAAPKKALNEWPGVDVPGVRIRQAISQRHPRKDVNRPFAQKEAWFGEGDSPSCGDLSSWLIIRMHQGCKFHHGKGHMGADGYLQRRKHWWILLRWSGEVRPPCMLPFTIRRLQGNQTLQLASYHMRNWNHPLLRVGKSRLEWHWHQIGAIARREINRNSSHHSSNTVELKNWHRQIVKRRLWNRIRATSDIRCPVHLFL